MSLPSRGWYTQENLFSKLESIISAVIFKHDPSHKVFFLFLSFFFF